MDDNNSYGHVIGRKATIFGLIVLGLIGLIALRVWQLDSLNPIECGPESTAIFLKRFTDCAGLANLGDFLAGIFAPLAFIGLAAAFLMQREQLRLAVKDSKENQSARNREAALNYASVQANYRLDLYALRKQAFDKMVLAGTQYNGEVSDEMINTLLSALYDAQFVFPKEVHDWIMEMLQTATRLQRKQKLVDISSKRKGSGLPWSSLQEDQLNQANEEITELAKMIHNELLGEKMLERFRDFMMLPLKIEFESTGTT